MAAASDRSVVSDGERLSTKAILHLFRHLHDPASLQRNPITRHLFQDPVTGCLDGNRTLIAVSELRRLVLDGLEIAKDVDVMRGRDRQAQRQYTIIRKLYFNGHGVQDVAKHLGISIRQLYRERSEICARIAAHIWRNRLQIGAHATSGLTPFEFEVDRAQMSAEVGNAPDAYAILKALLGDCVNDWNKASIACTAASIAVNFGHRDVARENIALTRAFLERAKSEHSRSGDQELIEGQLSLVLSELRRSEGNVKGANVALNRAVDIASRLDGLGPDRARFCADVALERADALIQEGQFVPAGTVLNSSSLKASIALSPTVSRVHWQMTLALLTLTHAAGPGEGSVGLDMLRDALSRARSCGSFRLALRAMQGIAVYLAYCGMVDEAARAVRAVIAMAVHFPNTRVRAQALVEAADVLIQTSGSSEIIKLLNEADSYLIEGNSDWLGSKLLRARSSNLGEAYGEAWEAALAAEAAALRIGSHRFLSAAWREMAIAAYARGNVTDASERITAAVAELEYGAPPIAALSTYQAAATITREARWRKRARVLERELAALHTG